MELKLVPIPTEFGTGTLVLIEPLWNWNVVYNSLQISEVCSNWTFMELKHEDALKKIIDNLGF